MGGETRLSVMLRGLVLVLPLVVFLAENTDAVETLVDAEATLGVVAGKH